MKAFWLATLLAMAADERTDSPDHPLIEAAEHQDVAKARELLAQGTDPRVRPEHGLTPLMWAGAHGNALIASLLLEAGEDPRYGYAAEFTPLGLASSAGHLEVVEVLLDSGKPWSPSELVDPLAAAAGEGHPRTARALVEAGAELDALDRRGTTALIAAARRGRPETVRVLLELGAKVDRRDRDGRTALMWAAWMGERGIAERLHAHGADPRLRDRHGASALGPHGTWKDAVAVFRSWTEQPETPEACPVVLAGAMLWSSEEGPRAQAWRLARRPERGAEAWLIPYPSGEEAFRARALRSEPDPVEPDRWTTHFAPRRQALASLRESGQGRAALLWPADATAPVLVDPRPGDLPWGVVPEIVAAAIDRDGDGRADALVLEHCCGDPASSAECEYFCGANWLLVDDRWLECSTTGPA